MPQAFPFASAVGFVNSTGTGNQLLVALSNQKNHYIVLAPNNDARQSVPSSISSLDSIPTSTSSLQHTRGRNSRPNVLTDVVVYRVVFGHFEDATDYLNTTIGRIALGDRPVVMPEGKKNQVIAWTTLATVKPASKSKYV